MLPIADGADNKKVNKRKRSSAQESTANELTPQSKQQKLLTDQQQQQALLTAKEMETEALMATQSILDNDDNTSDIFVETSSLPSSVMDIPMVESEISNESIFETSVEECIPQIKNVDKPFAGVASTGLQGFGNSPKLQLNTDNTSPTISLSTTSFVTIPTITATTKKHATTIKLNAKVPNVGNILQGATAKQTNLPSVFFKSNKPSPATSPTLSSMANFIIKSNATTTSIASPTNLAITKAMQSNTLQQQLAISNAILLQHQQQKQQQLQQHGVVQQPVRPQFFISTKSNQGKPAVVSLQKIVNKKHPSPKSPNNSQGKTTVPLVNNVKHSLLSGKPQQTSSLGLTLGNLTSASLQNINQLISAKKNQAIINKQSKTRETIPAVSLALTNSSAAMNKPLHLPSKQNVIVTSGKPKDSIRTLISTTPAQQTSISLVNQNNQNTRISLSSIKQSTVPKFVVGSSKPQLVNQPQVSGLKFVTAKTVAAQQTPMQTLSLNQLVAAARANLQTATVRSGAGTPVAHIGATKIRPTNAASTTTTTTLQALLQVVQKSTQGGGMTPNAQLVIRPQQLATGVTGGDLQKIVRLPRATVIAKSTLSPSNTVSGVALQRQKSAGHTQSPVVGTIRATQNVTAPLKILLPRTTFSSGTATIRMSPNTVGSPSNRTPANIVFSSPNLVLSGQTGKISFSPKEQQSQEKK